MSLNTYVEAIRKQRGKAEAQKFLLSDPSIFIAFFAGLTIKDFHDNMMKSVLSVQYLLILFPEQHGKSTLISKWLTIYEIARNPNIRIALCHKNDETAWDWLLSIEKILEENLLLIEWFGPFKKQGEIWSKSAMNVAKRQIISENPTVRAIGAKPSTVGKGCDWFIGDDLVDMKNSGSDILRTNLESWLGNTANSMPRAMWDTDPATGWMRVPLRTPGGEPFLWPRIPIEDVVAEYHRRGYYDLGKIPKGVRDEVAAGKPLTYMRHTLIGTIYHVRDALSRRAGRVEKLPQGVLVDDAYRREHGIDSPDVTGWTVLYYDFWRDLACTEPLWPEKCDAAWFEQQIKIRGGLIEVNKRLRNRAVNEESAIFKEAFVMGGCYKEVSFPGMPDENLIVGQYEMDDLLMCVCDPSSGRRTRDSSFSSFLMLAFPRKLLEEGEDPYCNVIDAFRFQESIDEILDVMIGEEEHSAEKPRFWPRYRFNLGIFEMNDKQMWLLNNRRVDAFNARYSHRIIGIDTTLKKNDPESGILSLTGPIKNGLIKVAAGNPESKLTMRPLLDQLCSYPDGLSDYVMALWIGYKKAREYLQRGAGFYEQGYREGPYLINPAYEEEEDVPLDRPKPAVMAQKAVLHRRYPTIVVARKGASCRTSTSA